MKLEFLDDVLGVEVNRVFSCGGYYYRVTELGVSLEVKTNNGWKKCSHPEVIAVYKDKDNIHQESPFIEDFLEGYE